MRGLSDAMFRALGPDEVLALTRARRLRHVPGAIPDIAGFFGWPALETLIARDGAKDTRFYKDGRSLAQPAFAGAKGRVDIGGLRAAMADGISIVFNELDQRSDAVWREAIQLERALAALVEVGGIASFGEGHALDVHYDPMDMIIVQVAGRKRWHFHGEPVSGPTLFRKEADPGPVTAELVMAAGDLLFVPAGQHHQCQPLDDCLHLGFMLRRPDGRFFIRRILEQVRDNAVLGSQIPAYDDAGAVAAWEGRVKEEMVALIQAGDMAGFLEDWYRDWQKIDARGVFPGGSDTDK